jgi:guanylate kinase
MVKTIFLYLIKIFLTCKKIIFFWIFDNHYGTSIKTVSNNLQSGIDTILEIDWQGARQIKNKLPDAISIFILPPSISVLKDRLYKRNLDRPEVIENRMQKAKSEMLHYQEYDFLIVNDNFEKAKQELKTIILAQRLKTNIQESKLMATIQQLLQ